MARTHTLFRTVDKGNGSGRIALDLDNATSVTEHLNPQGSAVTHFVIVTDGQAHQVLPEGRTLEDLVDAEELKPAKKPKA